MAVLEVTNAEYYGQDMQRQYLSVHSLMDYMSDPATFWLKVHGKLRESKTDALVAGSLFHSFVNSEDDFTEFLSRIDEDTGRVTARRIFKATRGTAWYNDDDVLVDMAKTASPQLDAKNDYQDVWQFIQRAWPERNSLWHDGWEHEVVLTGEIGGAPFKGRLDALRVEGDVATIVDYKTLNLKPGYGYWWDEDSNRHNMTFAQERNYDLQMVAYRELVKQNYPEVEEVFIKLNVLAKSGRTQFASYPSGIVHVSLTSDDLDVKRFTDLATTEKIDAMTLLDRYSQPAYDLANKEEMPPNMARRSVLTRLSNIIDLPMHASDLNL